MCVNGSTRVGQGSENMGLDEHFGMYSDVTEGDLGPKDGERTGDDLRSTTPE